MDGYRDLYRAPFSAGYYTTPYYQSASYALSGDPYLSAYLRAPLDAYAAYQPELLRFHRYAAPHSSFLSPRRPTSPGRRPFAQTSRKPRPPHVQTLAPKKTSFKKMRKGFPMEGSTIKKSSQLRALQSKPLQHSQKVREFTGKALSLLATSLAKETQELHSLYRTGVDPSSGKKVVKLPAKNAAQTPLKQSTPNGKGQKRKADTPKKDEAPSSAKKAKGKKKKKPAKKQQKKVKEDEKSVISTLKAVKVEPTLLTDEEVEVFSALQNAACKAVGELLGIPDKLEEAEKNDAPHACLDGAKPVDTHPSSDGQVQGKVEEVTKPGDLSPEEEEQLEEDGYKFYSKFLEDNQDLRNLYLEKKDAGAFECLVCRCVNPESSKKFTNMTNLVMHTTMRKLKRPEHRGYGRAICAVLGWESLRSPKQPAEKLQVVQEGDPVKSSEVEEAPGEGKLGES